MAKRQQRETDVLPDGYHPVSSRSIRELVDCLVEKEGRKGRASEALAELKGQLEQDIETAQDEGVKRRHKEDLWFVEGYMQTPAAAIADINSANRKIKR